MRKPPRKKVAGRNDRASADYTIPPRITASGAAVFLPSPLGGEGEGRSHSPATYCRGHANRLSCKQGCDFFSRTAYPLPVQVARARDIPGAFRPMIRVGPEFAPGLPGRTGARTRAPLPRITSVVFALLTLRRTGSRTVGANGRRLCS